MISRTTIPISFSMSLSSHAPVTRSLRILAATACLAIGPLLHAAGPHERQFVDGPSQLTMVFPNGYPHTYGFHPLKITAVNAGDKPAAWDFSMIEYGMFRSGSENKQGYSDRIVVPPRQTVEREVLVAAGGDSSRPSRWSHIMVQMRNPSGQNDHWGLSSNGRNESHDVSVPTLITPKAARSLKNAPDEDSDFHSRLRSSAAASDWRAYTPFGVVVLTEEDWQGMSPAAQAALADWTRMGGRLQFADTLPPDAPATDVAGQPGRGMGSVHGPMTSVTFRNQPAVEAALANVSPAIEANQRGDSMLSSWLGGKRGDLLAERFTSWPMVLVLIGFFVMMTPVNLFLLAPSRRRFRLFVTIPAISLTACLLLALAVVLGDGLGGSGERFVWIESRPGTENRHYITQWQASRSGALFGTGFTVEDAAFVAPLRNPGSQVSVRVGSDRLECGGGWFTSRASQSQILQAARPGRGRIEWVNRDPAAPTAVSTFDFPLRDVHVRAADGTWWKASTMRQGETTRLEQVGIKQVNDVINASIHHLPKESDIRNMAQRRGHFVAFTDQPPAIASLSSVRWKDTGIVTGALANP